MIEMLNSKPLDGRLDGLFFAIDYLDGLEHPTAQKLSVHLIHQMGFLTLGGEFEGSCLNGR
jgi:hypothetical protein